MASTSALLFKDEETIGVVPPDAPEWCKNTTELTWTQRKAKMDAAEALKWAKKQIKVLQSKSELVPEWMDKLIRADAARGALQWTVEEAQRLQVAEKDVPEWMMKVAEEDAKWGRRWAACKAAELRADGGKVPDWMQDNAKKAIVEAAQQKLELIQAQIEILEEQKVFQAALISAGGDEKLAQKRLAAKSAMIVPSVKERSQLLETALNTLATAEEAAKTDTSKVTELKEAFSAAAKSAGLLARALERGFVGL